MNLEQSKMINNKIDADFKITYNQNVQNYNDHLVQSDAELKAVNNRVSNLVIASGGDNPNQVVDACVDVAGITHKTLKDRLDSDYRKVIGSIEIFDKKIKAYDSKILFLENQLRILYSQNTETITLYVSASRGNDKIADGTEQKPFKTIQSAVNKIPVISSATYIIEVDKGSYLEDVAITNIENNGIDIRSFNSNTITDKTKDTGVYVRSITFTNCGGYLACRGITLTDTKNASRGITYVRCAYGVIDRCPAQENTKGKEYVAYEYNAATGHVYGNDVSNQACALSSTFASQVIFAYANSGDNNTTLIKSSRSIVYNNNSECKGEVIKELGGQVF